MRIWIDPEKLKARNLTTQDVLAAIREQNIQVAAGQVGQSPAPDRPELPVHRHDPGPARATPSSSAISSSRPSRTGRGPACRLTRVKDVARVELGAQVYDQWCEISGKPAAGVGRLPAPRRQRPGSGRATSGRRWSELKPSFPEGMEYSIPFDTTDVRRRVDPRGLQDPVRGRRAGPDRDPGVPAGLAGRA